jgi:Holliday junction DNA helicase RuvA
MYSYIKGLLVEVNADHAIVEIGGIGYHVYIPLSFYTAHQKLNSEIIFHTSFIVREDSMRLFGFESKEEKALFEKLITISGLGPKTALAIIGQSDTIDLTEVISSKDVAALTRVPGIGKKTAERIIIELSDKLSSIKGKAYSSTASDAIAALIALGYKEKEAQKNVATALKKADQKATLSELISLALIK